MAELDSLLGCKISLISHQDIRYDGTLFSINQMESSIVLKDVKAFGTEDRVTDSSKAVPPSSSTLAFVTFPGQEIKDLYVHETAAPAPAPAAAPAVPQAENKPKHDNKAKHNKSEHVTPPAAPAHEKENKTTQAAKTQHKEKEKDTSNNNNKEAANKEKTTAGSHSGVGTGSHLLKLREKKAGDSAAGKVDANSEFDFQEGLKGFNKDEVLAEVSDANTKKYVKDDFFDNFGSGQAEDGKKTRMTASEERQLNQDTFGAIALTNQYRRGGRGRGGRGGGRGGGRSSGRGGNGRGRGGGRSTNDNKA